MNKKKESPITVLGIIKAALFLALVVVVLGAYTRLTDSGLGCPDWPGCYGHVYPEAAAEADGMLGKAWKEMIHRYAAGTLGLLIFGLFIRAVIKKKHVLLSTGLFLLLIFQAALGMWTVTWKLLPWVVMGHLLGGLTILSLLRYLQLKVENPSYILSRQSKRNSWIILGLCLVFFQIALGGWVSSNYAGLACIGFPRCNGASFLSVCTSSLSLSSLQDAFYFITPIGPDYEGGQLDSAARITVQMVHRVIGILTALYVLILGIIVYRQEKKTALRYCAIIAMILVGIQFVLGIILVTHLLPLNIAVAHNAVAALLLLTMVSWAFYSSHENKL